MILYTIAQRMTQGSGFSPFGTKDYYSIHEFDEDDIKGWPPFFVDKRKAEEYLSSLEWKAYKRVVEIDIRPVV